MVPSTSHNYRRFFNDENNVDAGIWQNLMCVFLGINNRLRPEA
jgi:hypothetical protein